MSNKEINKDSMNSENDLMILIPVHEFGEEVKGMLTKAIASVNNAFPIVISTIPSLVNDITAYTHSSEFKWGKVEVVSNVKDDSCGSFAELVNAGVNEKYKWFNILEFDDTYNDMFMEFFKYESAMHDVSVFMTLEELIDHRSGKFVGYGNEAPWASSFSEEIGFIDNDSLQQFFDFYLTGSYFKTDDWLAIGGLKPSMKLTFWYEFLLRLTKKKKKAFVIPKIGYYHIVNRPNSLMEQYRTTIDADESKWWYELAQKECSYSKDRNKTYSK